MSRIGHRSTTLLLLLAAAIPSLLWADKSQPIPPFIAHYQLDRGVIPVGEVVVTLAISGDGRYSYRSQTRLIGLAAQFRQDEIDEVSQGSIKDLQIVPEQYSYQHRRTGDDRNLSLNFDWHKNRAIHEIKDSRWSMAVPKGVQDKFSQQLSLMLAMTTSPKLLDIQVADGGGLKQYRYTLDGEEVVNTTIGDYQAVKAIRSKSGRPSQTTLWLAPELHYLPIRIERTRGGNPYRLSLLKIQWSHPND